jgi:hypothetical protein
MGEVLEERRGGDEANELVWCVPGRLIYNLAKFEVVWWRNEGSSC